MPKIVYFQKPIKAEENKINSTFCLFSTAREKPMKIWDFLFSSVFPGRRK
jgi:hypothetical protein